MKRLINLTILCVLTTTSGIFAQLTAQDSLKMRRNAAMMAVIELLLLDDSPAPQKSPAPTLVRPRNDSMNLVLTPRLSWNKATNDSAYILNVAQTNKFDTTIIFNVYVTSPDTSKEIPIGTLANKQVYYWRVAAIKKGGEVTAYSDTFKFSTIEASPNTPSLVSPVGKSNLSNNITVIWSKVSTSNKYLIEISKFENFSSIYKKDSTLSVTDTTKAFTGFGWDTTYYWRVRGANSGGLGSWSSIGSFKTNVAPITAVPVLILPNDNQNTGDSVKFVWNKVPFASQYFIQVCAKSSFDTTKIVETVVTDTFKIVTNLSSRKWYWRIKALNSNPSSVSNWSTTRSFNVNANGINFLSADRFSLSLNVKNNSFVYSIPFESRVLANLISLNGKSKSEIINAIKPKGIYQFKFPKSIASGTYILDYSAGNYTRKEILKIKK